MKNILLPNGKFALVDDEDYDKLNQFKWYISDGYAVRDVLPRGIKHQTIRMHRMIVNTPKGMDTDHINMDRLDNRRENLRVCNRSQNMLNTKAHSDNASGMKGVSWDKKKRKWRARIFINNREKWLGYFDQIIDAAHAYDEAMLNRSSEFARTNFS